MKFLQDSSKPKETLISIETYEDCLIPWTITLQSWYGLDVVEMWYYSHRSWDVVLLINFIGTL